MRGCDMAKNRKVEHMYRYELQGINGIVEPVDIVIESDRVLIIAGCRLDTREVYKAIAEAGKKNRISMPIEHDAARSCGGLARYLGETLQGKKDFEKEIYSYTSTLEQIAMSGCIPIWVSEVLSRVKHLLSVRARITKRGGRDGK